MKKFHLDISDPIIVEQGAVGDTLWGHYQFPGFSRTEDGAAYLSWSYNGDDLTYKDHDTTNIRTRAVSEDGGATWRDIRPTDSLVFPVMPNGKLFGGFLGKGAYPTTEYDKYTPGAKGWRTVVYFAEDIAEKEDQAVRAREIDPVTHEVTDFTCTVNWPYKPMVLHPGKYIYPLTQAFALSNVGGLTIHEGVMYFLMYIQGFDSDAESREKAVTKYTGHCQSYLFKSEDSGRTWDYLSTIQMEDEFYTEFSEGFGEPMMTVAPDGSFVMLLRTNGWMEHYGPSRIARSTDKGKTWSRPAYFDECGVRPQIVTLGCGVTLAGYGRPFMRIRATSDPAAMEWEAPITIPLMGEGKVEPGTHKSCFYVNFLPLDDHTALFAYSDFFYPNADGEPVKTVLVRKITVVED